MRIGLVDLDTSHPQSWLPIERELGIDVVGVWDGGSVHPKGYAEQFAAEHKIQHVFASIDDMVDEIDCAIIHSCNWDLHVERARPFVEAGKAVLIDKPMAGNLKDLQQFVSWVKQGARLTGGSSLRFCIETREWLLQPVDERGTPDTAFCGCGVDEFNYGIHAYSLLSGIMGRGIASAQHLGMGAQHRVRVNWKDGRTGFVLVGQASGWIPFHASISTEKSVTQFQTDNSKLYRALLETVLPYLSGKSNEPPMPIEDLIEPELSALAARKSLLEGGREVPLTELTLQDEGYDGAVFAEGYRKSKYP